MHPEISYAIDTILAMKSKSYPIDQYDASNICTKKNQGVEVKVQFHSQEIFSFFTDNSFRTLGPNLH